MYRFTGGEQSFGLFFFLAFLHSWSKWVNIFLQWTVSKAAAELTVSTMLLATHLYSSLSVLFTLVIVSCLLSCVRLILGLAVVFTADPSMVHENVGGGLPFALHVNAAFDPSFTIWLCGSSENSGWSVLRNQIQWKILLFTGRYKLPSNQQTWRGHDSILRHTI